MTRRNILAHFLLRHDDKAFSVKIPRNRRPIALSAPAAAGITGQHRPPAA
jgi:hypothetical protein